MGNILDDAYNKTRTERAGIHLPDNPTYGEVHTSKPTLNGMAQELQEQVSIIRGLLFSLNDPLPTPTSAGPTDCGLSQTLRETLEDARATADLARTICAAIGRL